MNGYPTRARVLSQRKTLVKHPLLRTMRENERSLFESEACGVLEEHRPREYAPRPQDRHSSHVHVRFETPVLGVLGEHLFGETLGRLLSGLLDLDCPLDDDRLLTVADGSHRW